MTKRIFAIFAIFLFTTAAWVILGTTVNLRTHAAGSGLRERVASLWGNPHVQLPPRLEAIVPVEKTIQKVENGVTHTETVPSEKGIPIAIDSSTIDVGLALEQRQKGLLWFPTYTVDFSGAYAAVNDSESPRVRLRLPFPSPGAIYDELVLNVNGEPVRFTTENSAIQSELEIPPGTPIEIELRYRSQGMDVWSYSFGEGIGQIRDFQLSMTTDFDAIDFADDTLAPTAKERTDRGWKLDWRYENLLSGSSISMVMPEKLQPGPLAARISFFAPVSLLFFFFLIFIITTLRGIDLHPMHYFFLACAFFAFHLLLAYLVDHISIHLAFAISSAISVFLVVSYLRIVVNGAFAWREAALSQLVYLVAFSYAFFFRGFTGLAVTIGAILTLFLVMQMTAKVDWSDKWVGTEGRSVKIEG